MRSVQPSTAQRDASSAPSLDDVEAELALLPSAVDSTLLPFVAGLEPPIRLTVSEWADAHRILADDAKEPGRYRTDRVPYLRPIMDSLSSDSPHSVVVFKKATQLGATECGNNWLAYLIEHSPQTVIYIMPTDDLAKRASRQRIEPMIRDCDLLCGLVEADEDRHGIARKSRRETVREKYWAGGRLTLVSAKSSAGLKNLSAQNLFADELDEWPRQVGKQGDPFAVARKRLDAFAGQSKVFAVSSPTAVPSRICELYDLTDQQVLEVPCPHCQHYQVLTFDPPTGGHIRWPEGMPEDAYMVCEACGGIVTEDQKPAMLALSRFRPTAKGRPGWIGFAVSALYSPFFRWRDCAEQWLDAKGDPEQMRTFVNTVLGEPYKDDLKSVDVDDLTSHVEEYGCEVPRGVLAITAGWDTQDNRVEGVVIGFGIGLEAWVLGYHRIYGDPDDPDFWGPVDDQINHLYQHADIYSIPIACAMIDSRGHKTDAVYAYCRGKEARRIYAIAGVADNGRRPLVGPPMQKRTGTNERHCELRDVCTDIARGHVYAKLNVTERGPGFWHFPSDNDGRGCDVEFFRQLCGMEFEERIVRGRSVRIWKLKQHRRKESLDAVCYALAALHQLNPEWNELAKRREQQAERAKLPSPPRPPGQPAPGPNRPLGLPGPGRRPDTGTRRWW